jgi:DNA-binding MarR family transcriptional regulator
MNTQTAPAALLVPDDLHDRLATDTLKKFRIIFSSVKTHLGEIEAQCGISSSQLWVLWELHKTPGLKVTELAAKLSIHQSTASNLIEKLSRRALIAKKREDIDQRVVRLYLTEAGISLVMQAPPSPRGILRDALDDLDIEEMQQLQQSLQTLISRSKLENEADAMRPLADI